ncbi:MAG TPA: carboxymuconolactone decarboxylase family protein [Ilumatobacteraceae bacterium]|jgi:4-carboxymuconolactone decarboxylase
MHDYLPLAYREFRATYPDVANSLDQLGQAADGAGPLDERTRRLVHLGIAIGAVAEGAVRSNVRKALDAGASVDEIRQVSLLAITTSGFPTAIAGLGWTEEVLGAR